MVRIPFNDLAFVVKNNRLSFKEHMSTGWEPARDVGSIPLDDVAYDLGNHTNNRLSTLFPIYDWDIDEGFEHLGMWIELEAIRAGH